MIYCERCRTAMKFVMRFDGVSSFKLKRCPICHFETRPTPLIFEDTIQNNKIENKKQELERSEQDSRCIAHT